MEQAAGPSQEAVVKSLLGARDAMIGIRHHLRQMGEAAGVPVGYCCCTYFSYKTAWLRHSSSWKLIYQLWPLPIDASTSWHVTFVV